MKHYTSEELDQYRHKDMNFILRFICRIHLCFCSDCRAAMLQLRHDDTLLLKIKNSMNKLKIEANPVTYQKINTTIHNGIKNGTPI